MTEKSVTKMRELIADVDAMEALEEYFGELVTASVDGLRAAVKCGDLNMAIAFQAQMECLEEIVPSLRDDAKRRAATKPE